MAILQTLSDTILDALTTRCKDHYGRDLVSVIVYGSVARTEQTFHSDIDLLLIVKDLPHGRMKRMHDFAVLENQMSKELNRARQQGWHVDLSPVIRTPEEVNAGGYFYLDMVDDSLILYDKDKFFSEFLTELKKRLKKYGAEKRKWKGGYYWIIKPDIKPGEVIQI